MNFAELDVSLGKASRHQVESFVFQKLTTRQILAIPF
jgi:hypothetical protein